MARTACTCGAASARTTACGEDGIICSPAARARLAPECVETPSKAPRHNSGVSITADAGH